jgi:hypothetical protein
MWEKFWNVVTQVISLTEKTDRNTQDIKDLQREVRQLAMVVQQLASDIERNAEREKYEREKVVLILKNELLVFEKRLPSGNSGDGKD